MIFDGWTDSERRGWILLGEWEAYFKERAGYPRPVFTESGQKLSPERTRTEKRFGAYVEAAEWVMQKGHIVGHNWSGWKGYLRYVLDELLSKNMTPSPRHLMHEWKLEQFNGGCNMSKEAKPERNQSQMSEIYRKRLHPSLRFLSSLKILGLE